MKKHVQEEAVELVPSPDLAHVQSMFPNFDKETVREALDSTNGSLGRAVEALLVSSDFLYVMKD